MTFRGELLNVVFHVLAQIAEVQVQILFEERVLILREDDFLKD